jgi:hypothetical protein
VVPHTIDGAVTSRFELVRRTDGSSDRVARRAADAIWGGRLGAARVPQIALWSLVIALSIVVFLYPTIFSGTTADVESIEVIQPFRPFAILYLFWTLGILSLIHLRSNSPARSAGNVILVAMFAAIFWGFWIKNTPWGFGQDSVYNAGIIRYIEEHGTFAPGIPNLVYFDFPAIHAIGAALSYASGLDIFLSATILRFTFAVGVAVAMYLSMTFVIESSSLALVGGLLFVQGSLNPAPSSVIFYPSSMAFVLFVMLWLFSLVAQSKGQRLGELVGYLIVFSSLTIAHLVTSAAAFAILLVQRFRGILRAILPQVDTNGLPRFIVAAVILLAWEAYWASVTFQVLLLRLAHPHPTLASAQHSIEGGVLHLPLWASITRLVWLGVAVVLGIVAILRMLYGSSLRSWTARTYAAGLAGVLTVGVVATLISPSGEFARLIYMLPVFTIPLALALAVERRTLVLSVRGVATILIFTTALPAFLVSQHGVATASVREDQLASGDFVRLLYGEGNGLVVYGNFNAGRSGILAFYTPQASVATHDQFERATFWPAENALRDEFFSGAKSSCRKVYVFEERARMALYRLTYSIDPQDTKWDATREELQRLSSRVYDNGHGQVYAPTACLR